MINPHILRAYVSELDNATIKEISYKYEGTCNETVRVRFGNKKQYSGETSIVEMELMKDLVSGLKTQVKRKIKLTL